MRSAAHLDPDALLVALESAETLLKFRDFMPPGGLLVVVLGKFRDDLRDALEMEAVEHALRGHHSRALDELDTFGLCAMAGAIMILRQPRFTRVMDDPALPEKLEEMEAELTTRKRTLALLRETAAKAS